jgi:hypothetical protein
MKLRFAALTVFAVVCLFAVSSASAQMGGGGLGSGFFKKPTLAKYYNPVVGKGAEYQNTSNGKSTTLQLGVVGKGDGGANWIEMVMNESNKTIIIKTLFSIDDAQVHTTIFQMVGGPAMEMPQHDTGKARASVEENMSDYHSLGTETITVPAGTFSCDHYKNDKNGAEVWMSDKVPPYGMVKEIHNGNTMVLNKVLSDYADKITGPVQPFNPMALGQMMQQRNQ